MTKEENVINFYLICNRLKNVIRTGWKTWNVKKERIESVAEHIYGTQMLALAMKSEYSYDIDIEKVIYLLAIHELGETLIGDITQFEMAKEEKTKKEHNAVHEILKDLLDGKIIEELFLEFDEKKTKEAQFAYQCDKLECDIQCKIYDEEGCVDMKSQKNNISLNEKKVKQLCATNASWSDAWIKFGQENYNYDSNFMKTSNYILNNCIKKEKE